jgi:hypothetical protein
MNWDSDTAETRIRFFARTSTQHQCVIGWHLIPYAARSDTSSKV